MSHFFFHETGAVGFREFFGYLLMVFFLSTFFFIKMKFENSLMYTLPPPYRLFFSPATAEQDQNSTERLKFLRATTKY